jgi:glycosyltransferase involved in cell wall biosynthesis
MTEKAATVSVIIPTYNSSGTLRLALRTVLSQDLTDFEVWVVGDGCTDDSENVVASLADDRLHWVNRPSNSGGPSMPRNDGLRRAKGRFIAYLGHDDLWFPWHLSGLVNCIESNKSDFAYSIGVSLAPDGVTGVFTVPSRPWSPNANLSPINWLHRKSLTEDLGFWTDVKVGDDREFLHRVLSAKTKLGYHKQLSALRFPSADWRMYSFKTDFPQTRYVKAICEDATRLRDELLLDIATLMSQRGFLHEQGGPLYRSLRGLPAHIAYLYGVNRWPVNRLIYRRYRRKAGLD